MVNRGACALSEPNKSKMTKFLYYFKLNPKEKLETHKQRANQVGTHTQAAQQQQRRQRPQLGAVPFVVVFGATPRVLLKFG